MREELANAGFADGWSVLPRGRTEKKCVQVQHSWLAPGGERHKSAARLPIEWKRGCTSDVVHALKFVKGAMEQGKTLREAVANLKARDPKTTDAVTVNWEQAFANWRRWKIDTGACSTERSFDITHGARWRHTMQAVDGHPQNASELFEAATMSTSFKDGVRQKLNPGSQMRRMKLQTINAFLTYCCEREGFDDRWRPPSDYAARYLGRSDEKTQRYGIPEAAIKPLMESFRDTDIGKRWRLAVGLMICFGLRPWELRHLEVEDGFLKVTKGKRNSRTTTEERICVGLDPVGMPNLSNELLVQLRCGVPGLPKLGNIEGNTAGRVREYLRGIPFWVQLKKQCAEKNEEISPYSFRHRYAFELDRRGYNDREASSFMGNSREVFARHYGEKVRKDELKAAVKRVQRQQADQPSDDPEAALADGIRQ